MYVLDKTITEREKHHDTHDTLLEDMDISIIILCYMIWIILLSHNNEYIFTNKFKLLKVLYVNMLWIIVEFVSLSIPPPPPE